MDNALFHAQHHIMDQQHSDNASLAILIVWNASDHLPLLAQYAQMLPKFCLMELVIQHVPMEHTHLLVSHVILHVLIV